MSTRTTASTVTVDPTQTWSIEGHSDLNRQQYFSIAQSAGDGLDELSQEQFDYYFRELGITFGRRVNLLLAGHTYEEIVFEDPDRPGRVDIDRLKNEPPRTPGKFDDQLREMFPDGLDLVGTENFLKTTWPPFMETYVREEDTTGHHPMVKDHDAAAEGMIAYLNHRFNDWDRPRWFEGLNEPDWFFNVYNDESFFGLHEGFKNYRDEAGLNMEVGGPCFPTSQYFKNNYQTLPKTMGHFIDQTECDLDFYSFHPYDYTIWDEEAQTFDARVTGGLPMDADLDALVNYTVLEHGKEIDVVISEHGAYMVDTAVRYDQIDALGVRLFPELSDWDRWMKQKEITDFMMVNGAIAHTLTFMDHPHTVEKAIPFILLEASSWKPDHYAALLVSKDHQSPAEEWVESRMVDFWKVFKDVDGRRVRGWSIDPDIQQQSFVDGDRLFIVLNNLAGVPQDVTLDIANADEVQSYELRRLSRNEDFTPNYSEQSVESVDALTLAPQESVVVVATYAEPIVEAQRFEESVHYGDRSCVELTGQDSATFKVAVPDVEDAETVTLRIAVGRPHGTDRDLAVKFNGHAVTIPVEDSADRLDRKHKYADEYGALKRVRIPAEWLEAENAVEVSFPDGTGGGIGSVVLRVSRASE
ncbi:hypothetical protein HNQ40_001164 [Algisphaera agarilytica]|uniref:Beta-agarase n=1 Tax=Algisphaera agarilytica TaxID=1385975 RepID=A0A7X0H581_9BACT|nr:hypothetical protein [Algisphaera agarilytica]